MSFFTEILAKTFEFWHKYVSMSLAPACRHEPTCSLYGAEALRKHGFMRGMALTLWRILRCNPWGSFGYDPVPKR